MRSSKLSIVSILFCLLLCTKLSAGIIPSWGFDVDYLRTYVPHEDQVSDGMIYLFSDTQVNIDTREIYHFLSIKVTDENGLSDASSITIDYDKEYQTFHFNHVHIIRNGKTIDVLLKQKPEELRREDRLENGIVDGSITSYLDVNDLRVGDIIEYSYTLKGFNPIKKDFLSMNYNLGFSVPIGKVRVVFLAKDDNKYDYNVINSNVQPEIKKIGDQTAFKWELDDPDITVQEDNEPSWYNPYPKVYFYKKSNWKELAMFISQLYTSDKGLNDEANQIVSEIESEYKTKAEQAREIIRYVQNQIRYLGNENGIYGYKPRHPNVIISKKSGDCKEKSWTLCMLLQKIGIPAFPVLVSTYNGYKLHELPASLESFNHCVTCLVYEKDTIYVDPTITNQGGDLQHLSFPKYDQGLIISSSTIDLTQIPYKSQKKTYTEETYDIKDMSGTAVLNVKTIYSGVEADYERSYFKNTAKKAIQDNYLEYYANVYPNIDTIKILNYEDDIEKNDFVVYESYQLNDIWEAGDTLKPKDVSTYFYANNLKYLINIDNDPDRTTPMYLSKGRDFNQVITVNLPYTWTINSKNQSVKGPGFEFEREVEYDDKVLTLKFHHLITRSFIEKEEYSEYVKKNEQVEDLLSYGLLYYGTSGSAPSDGSVSPIPIILGIFVIIIGFMFARKLYVYNPEPEFRFINGSRRIGGWLVLPAIGITISPLLILTGLISEGFLNAEAWSGLFNPETSNYSLSHSLLIFFEFTFNILLMVFAVLNSILFYGKRSNVPTLMIAFYVTNSVFVIADAVFSYSLHIRTDYELTKEIVKSIIGMAIWGPYFMNSDRVKETFTRRLSEYKLENIKVRSDS